MKLLKYLLKIKLIIVKKAKELGLDNQVFELADYREIKGEYDKIYSWACLSMLQKVLQ